MEWYTYITAMIVVIAWGLGTTIFSIYIYNKLRAAKQEIKWLNLQNKENERSIENLSKRSKCFENEAVDLKAKIAKTIKDLEGFKI